MYPYSLYCTHEIYQHLEELLLGMFLTSVLHGDGGSKFSLGRCTSHFCERILDPVA